MRAYASCYTSYIAVRKLVVERSLRPQIQTRLRKFIEDVRSYPLQQYTDATAVIWYSLGGWEAIQYEPR